MPSNLDDRESGKKKSPKKIPKALPVKDGEPDWMPAKPQFLQGRMTFIGLILALIGNLAARKGITIPVDETTGLLNWLSAHWGDIAGFIGWLAAWYGRLRINWRK